MGMDRNEILNWLRESREEKLSELWRMADDVRFRCVGDEVYLRGLAEISNYCMNNCCYCGIRAGNKNVVRYRLTREEIFCCVDRCIRFGYGTIVMQAGEDEGISGDWLADIIREIKERTDLAVTLSLGDRGRRDLELWKAAGADRYLIRFETSDAKLFERVHKGNIRKGSLEDRLRVIRLLRELGYEVGSGVLIGLPGQSYESLADDIELICELDLDMIGVGPYIAHRDSSLHFGSDDNMCCDFEQVPNSDLMAYKMISLLRILCPFANIPSTTAIATVNKENGRQLGLMRGANVIMPNVTPMRYRELYSIYPGKACLLEAEEFDRVLRCQIYSIGRKIGVGRGDSRHKILREERRCLQVWN